MKGILASLIIVSIWIFLPFCAAKALAANTWDEKDVVYDVSLRRLRHRNNRDRQRQLQMEDMIPRRSSCNADVQNPSPTEAAIPRQQGGPIVADGTISDWDLDADFISNMYESGKSTKQLATKAYARFDCSSNTLCVLVMTDTQGVQLEGQYWFKDYGVANSAVPPINDQINQGIQEVVINGAVVGWEGCFVVLPSCRADIEIHANYFFDGEGGRTSSTGKIDYSLGLDLTCPICESNDDCVPDDDCVEPICDLTTGTCDYLEIDECLCDPSCFSM